MPNPAENHFALERAAATCFLGRSRSAQRPTHVLPHFRPTHQRDLNFSPAQGALSNEKRPAAKSGAFLHRAGRNPQRLWGARMIGFDQTGRRATGAVAAVIAIASTTVASAII